MLQRGVMGSDPSVACGDSSPFMGAFWGRSAARKGSDPSVACGDSSLGEGALGKRHGMRPEITPLRTNITPRERPGIPKGLSPFGGCGQSPP